MSTSSITPLSLTGVSQYASDFQSVLNRAVKIAQIPVTLLQNKDSDLLQKKTLLSTLNSAVSGLADSLKALGTLASGKALGASSSDSTVVTATSTGATAAATYTINSVTSAASAASERTSASFVDAAATPVSSSGQITLVTGSGPQTFALTNNTLIGLRDKINSLNSGVTASILTVPGGNYLSLTANNTGATTLQLYDGPDNTSTNLLTASNQGTNAVFQLNGIPISQAGNTVNSVIPGVTLNIQKASNTPVTVTLASDPTKLSSALQDFVTQYNALTTQIHAQQGPGAGLLLGDSVITQLSSALRKLTSYTAGSGSVHSLADLGVELSSTGQASFNQQKFNALDGSQIADGLSFLGSASSGIGGFSANFNAFSDPISGIIKLEQSGIDRQDLHLQSQIATLTDRINFMQASLAVQLHKADALEASFESQQQALTASLQAVSLVNFGKKT